jgi:hypothetical protein
MQLARSSARQALGVVLGMLLLSACDEPFAVRVGPPAALRHAAGNGQRDTVGAVLPESLAVRVVDRAGNPVSGVAVTWGHGPTAGTIDPAMSITNTDGIARARWKLGLVPGGHTATANVDGVAPLTFGAVALAIVRAGPLGWALVHQGLPAPPSPIIGIAGSNASDVFVATATGEVYWYDGFGWSELISSPAPGPLRSMWGPASTAIFATGMTTAGDAAFVARFTGQGWTAGYSSAADTLHALHGRSPDDLWAVGTAIVHYDGTAWTRRPVPGATARAVWAAAPGVAFIGDENGAIHRIDTTATQLGNPLGVPIRVLFGFGPDDAYAGDANGTVLRWNGSQWSFAAQLGPAPIAAMGGSGPDDLWVAGGVYAHFDRGAWEVLDDDQALAAGTVGLWGDSPDNVWAVTGALGLKQFDGTVWREHWDSPVAFEGVWGSSAADVHVCGGQGTVQRLNGNAWDTERLAGWQSCRSVHGASSTFAIASTGGPFAYRLSGDQWVRFGTGAALNGAIWTHGSGIAMAPGPAGTVLRYDGSSWSPLATGSPALLHAVWGSSPADVWAGGTGGTLLHYDGTAWTPVPSGTSGTVRRIWGTSAALVFAVADESSGSQVLRYDGAAWQTVHASVNRLWSIHGRTATDVYAVGEAGTIVRWDGQQWHAESSSTAEALTDVWASPEGDVFAVGARGLIVRGRR